MRGGRHCNRLMIATHLHLNYSPVGVVFNISLDCGWSNQNETLNNIEQRYKRLWMLDWMRVYLIQVAITLLSHMNFSLVENMVKKEPQSFSHCGSFDHHDLQPLNDCIFVFLVLQLQF